MHHFPRIAGGGDFGHPGNFLERAGSHESALADMAPELAILFQHGQGLAQFAARNAKHLAELPFRRQLRVGVQVLLRQIGAQLRERALCLVHFFSSPHPSLPRETS